MVIEEKKEININRSEIIKYIKNYIKKNKLKEDDKLPSENSLADLFKVNRNVVRSAMNHLKSQGYIYSQKGKGAFVAHKIKAITFEHTNDLGFSEILGKNNETYKSRILNWKKSIAGPYECKIFNLDKGENVYRIRILRCIDKTPLAVCYSILPEKLVPELENHLENFASINKILINDYGYSHPICDSVNIEAACASEDEIKILKISDNIPILKQASIFSVEDNVIEYFIVRARGDRFKFSMNFKVK